LNAVGQVREGVGERPEREFGIKLSSAAASKK
jgi:hypothetical protein